MFAIRIIMDQTVIIVSETILNGTVQTISVRVRRRAENGMPAKKPVFAKQGIGAIIVPIVREQMPHGTVRIKNVFVPVVHGVLHQKSV